jgi:ubiquinone/menaquinone biosynthesis C-methylase UbiE
MADYHPETYWNEVAGRIAGRESGNVIAGDDEPFYRYKRKKFLGFLHAIDFHGKCVLEVGSGPGGNLIEVLKHGPLKLTGLDISPGMVNLSRQLLEGTAAEVVLLQEQRFPFADQSFDIVFTSTVLQHTTDPARLAATISEICRVSAGKVYIFERIEKRPKGDVFCLGRTVEEYAGLFAVHGFTLRAKEFLNIQSSYLVSGAIRKIFNRKKRKEGEELSFMSIQLQKISLPFTSLLDKWIRADRDLAMLEFQKDRI